VKPNQVLEEENFKRCVDFHGHICPGLAIGYRAAQAGLRWLEESRAGDEELIAVVETDACGADAIQVITGCTLGKGNLFHRDLGKQAFTLTGRKSGQGVRVALKPGVLELSDRHRQLMDRIRAGTALAEERREFQGLHLETSRDILEKPMEDLFTIQKINLQVPPKAKIEPSGICSRCGEPVMASRLEEKEGVFLCRDCLQRP